MSESDARGKQITAQVIVLGPGQGRKIPGPGGITLKATAQETAGAVGFLEATTASKYEAPPHIHHDCDELFYVLEGQFRFLVGERTVSAPAGTFVFIPRGTVHAAQNSGAEPGKVLAAYIPGGVEQSFEEFARSPGQRNSVAEKTNSEFVSGPPKWFDEHHADS
jgi:quercetin 2,3-dioxygenase